MSKPNTCTDWLEYEEPLPEVTWRKRKAVARGLEGVKRWTRVEKATYWRPVPGEVLEGLYGGSATRTRNDGTPYAVHIVHTQYGVYQVSGTVLRNLFESASLNLDDPVKVVFKGKFACKNSDHTYGDYDLFVGRS